LYILLHRALKNAGDFLIFRRAKALIDQFHPDVTTKIGRAWLPVEDQFSKSDLSNCRAIIVCGGPGYQNDLHIDLYPHLNHQMQAAPVILLALGSYLFPGTEPQIEAFRFNDRTVEFLRRTGTDRVPLSARDALTAEILRRNGLGQVFMTGDPAWYDLEAIDRPMPIAEDIRSLAFTPPANPLFDEQAGEFMRLLTVHYPVARKSVVFHRGTQRAFHVLARRLGWRVEEISGSADGFTAYDAVDVHVGYRLHAHLYSLSRAIPSYLLAEDSRGIGALRTLGGLGAHAITTQRRPIPFYRTAHVAVSHAPTRLRSTLGRVLSFPLAIDSVGPSQDVIEQIHSDIAAGWKRHETARQRIRETLPTMRQYISAFP
jgi:hypothetical protein